jgi:hypothetical protein
MAALQPNTRNQEPLNRLFWCGQDLKKALRDYAKNKWNKNEK